MWEPSRAPKRGAVVQLYSRLRTDLLATLEPRCTA